MRFKNIVAAFDKTVETKTKKTAFRFVEHKEWQALSWTEARERVFHIVGGLSQFGVEAGDRVAILSRTCVEWTLCDLAILATGAVTVPIYESLIEDQVEYILQDSKAKVVFVQNQVQLSKVLQVQDKLPELKQIVVFEGLSSKKQKGVYSLDEFMLVDAAKGPTVYHQNLESVERSALASIVYTSGTTGNPKGVCLSHNNFLSENESLIPLLNLPKDTESLMFLPLAHILARVAQFLQIEMGYPQAYAESIDRLSQNIMDVKPHFMISVPRIFEKIHTKTMQSLENASSVKKNLFNWAMGIGKQVFDLKNSGKSVPLTLSLQHQLAHKLVFSKLHNKLGGRFRFFVTGGAPLAKEVGKFFQNFGFIILEGYGLTETTAAVAVNRFDKQKMGTVGPAILGAEFKIADDGEILVKGPMVSSGYYNRPKETKEVFETDGWFHTGDIGEFDDEGYLKITDRKKDIIVTAGGKNVAPQNIENIMKTDPYISQFVVHGDRRKFLSALVTLNQDEILDWAKTHQIHGTKYDDIIQDKKLYDFIKARIEEKNKHLSKFETIKRFAILPNDFTVETGELTPTLKVKRKVISERYHKILDGFYKD